MNTVTLNIDGIDVTVPENYTIIEAAKEIGVEIPALCYDPNLELVSSCRLCIVDVKGKNKLETACSTRVREGMVVNTKTKKIIELRRNIIQLLLDSHPNDCLTCDKAGECLLQKYAYDYNVKFREHDGAKRPELLDETSPYIIKDNSKCILCGKCVRTCAQIKQEREVLSFSERGYNTKISLDLEDTFESSTCVSCNRCVSLCPTGALMDRRALDKVRVWDANIKKIRCNVCAYGCEFELLQKNNKNVAVRALPPTKGRPLCLKGRLATELKYLDNPDTPYRKIDSEFKKDKWIKVLGLEEIMDNIESLEGKEG